ncbi:MAG: AAA family ATPase [Cyanobacteria bacterium J06632_3]
MPTFPTPPSPVPYCLNPLNPKHALLIGYWVYFCPTALKYYLYQANPSLYKASFSGGLLKTLTCKAYRNLYLCLPQTIVLISIGLSAIAQILLPPAPFSWFHWGLGLGIGDFIGITFFIIFGITFSLTAGNARGAAGGSMVSVTAGVAITTVLAIVLGRSPDWSFAQLLVTSNFGVIALFGLVMGISISLPVGGVIGGIVGIATGLTSGLLAGVVFGIIETTISQVETSSLVYATVVGLATMGAIGASMTISSGLVISLLLGVFVGLSINIALVQDGITTEKAILYGGIATLIVWTGTLRLPMYIGYLLYVFLSAIPGLSLKHHPIAWDELIFLPLPGTSQYLEGALRKNQSVGLQRLIQAVQNPLQRPVVQRVFKAYLRPTERPTERRTEKQPGNFLRRLYQSLAQPVCQAYVFAPFDQNDWEHLPASKQLLLGELSSQWVNCTAELTSYRIERFFYGMTWLQRDHTRTPQSDFYRLLYDMSYGSENQIKRFNLSSYAPTYMAFEGQPGGLEISQSFDAIANFLNYTHISHLAKANKLATQLPPASEAIRPDIVDILNRLKQLAYDISHASQSNSLFMQQASLLRANSTLEALHQRVCDEVVSPEFRLIKQIIQQWIHFVREAGGEIGRRSYPISFIKNPYVIGTPVSGDALVGREDIFRRITDELFATPGQCPSIVLYGHRRMGKSSILRSLSEYLSSPQIKVVDFNMQILGHISDTGELLYALAQQINRALAPERSQSLPKLERPAFIKQNPYHALNDFFLQIDPALSGYSLIIAIDEFEKVEEKIEKGQLSESVLEFLRGLTQTFPWFSLIFAGLHTLEEMCYSYWHPFFTSIPIRVSFLPAAAARQLILQTNNIAYEDDVVTRIVQLTNGQPYLIQLIGHTLVTYFNRNLLDKRNTSNDFLVFNAEDLQKVLDSPEFYSIGNAYFKGVWLQALASSVVGQIEVLKQLAKAPMTAQQLVDATGLSQSDIALAINTLREHDVVVFRASAFTYAVELMRMWVVSNQLSN